MAAFAERAYCWYTQPVLVHGVIPFHVQDFIFPFVALHAVPACILFRPVEVGHSEWQTSTPVYQALSPVLYHLQTCGRVHPVPSSRSLMKVLNTYSPSMKPGAIPLVTGLQLHLMPLITRFSANLFSQFSVQLTVCLCSPYLLVCQQGYWWTQC